MIQPDQKAETGPLLPGTGTTVGATANPTVEMQIPWWMNLEWRTRKRVMLLLCAFEFAPTIAALTLFGIADPDTYRTKLWQEGANHGWNSDPIELVYAAANYKPIKAPTPWNQL